VSNSLKRVTSLVGTSLSNRMPKATFDNASPFKVQMNLDIPNLSLWVQWLDSYFTINIFIIEEGKITIATLEMSTLVHCWWENFKSQKEEEGTPICTWDRFLSS
jgi:hypothetical protein